jgi:hypothetical protein
MFELTRRHMPSIDIVHLLDMVVEWEDMIRDVAKTYLRADLANAALAADGV